MGNEQNSDSDITPPYGVSDAALYLAALAQDLARLTQDVGEAAALADRVQGDARTALFKELHDNHREIGDEFHNIARHVLKLGTP